MSYTFENSKDWTDDELSRLLTDSKEALQQTFGGTEQGNEYFAKLFPLLESS